MTMNEKKRKFVILLLRFLNSWCCSGGVIDYRRSSAKIGLADDRARVSTKFVEDRILFKSSNTLRGKIFHFEVLENEKD